jgi:RNA recognition motif-containing protein
MQDPDHTTEQCTWLNQKKTSRGSDPKCEIESKNENTTHKMQNSIFHLNQARLHEQRRSPPSLPHLIGNYKLFLAHFYSRNAK